LNNKELEYALKMCQVTYWVWILLTLDSISLLDILCSISTWGEGKTTSLRVIPDGLYNTAIFLD